MQFRIRVCIHKFERFRVKNHGTTSCNPIFCFLKNSLEELILRDLSRVFMQATKAQTNLRVFSGHTQKVLDVTTTVQSCSNNWDCFKTDPERG